MSAIESPASADVTLGVLSIAEVLGKDVACAGVVDRTRSLVEGG
jgi:hypothetical protein